MTGYSATPLTRKLGIKSGHRICLMGAPPDYRKWLAPLPEDVSFSTRPGTATCDLTHLFVDSLRDLDRKLPRARQTIGPDGTIWVSWRKKSSGFATDVSEDAVRACALQTDLVDVKVCAVTEIWSGLKLVVRKHLR